MKLIRDLADGGVGHALRSDIGREQVVVCLDVELPLVADQDIDRTLEFDRRIERIFEPDMKVVRRRWHAVLRHRTKGLFRDRRRVLEIDLVERGLGHDWDDLRCRGGEFFFFVF